MNNQPSTAESLLNIHSWQTEVEFKRWIVHEYLASQDYRNRLKFFLKFINNYFTYFYKSKQLNLKYSLPHVKIMKGLIKENFQSRWASVEDTSHEDPLSALQLIYDICHMYNTITDSSTRLSITYALFILDKTQTLQNAESEKRSDIDSILSASLSFPCFNFLESYALFVLSQSKLNHGTIEIRPGYRLINDCYYSIFNGKELLNNLPQNSPLFAKYVFYSLFKRLNNKLSSIFISRKHPAKIDVRSSDISPPDIQVLRMAVDLLWIHPTLAMGSETIEELILADLTIGEVRVLQFSSMLTYEELCFVSLGWNLWFNDTKSVSDVFDRLHVILLDVLDSQKILIQESTEASIEQPEEGEEGELEMGELVDDPKSISCQPPNNACFQMKLAKFVLQVVEFDRYMAKESLRRFNQIVNVLQKVYPLSESQFTTISSSHDATSEEILNNIKNFIDTNSTLQV